MGNRNHLSGIYAEPLITVGVPVYNGAKTIGACLESLIGQTYKNLEIIISDNCSSDETFAICESFAKRDPRITLIRQNHNLGGTANFSYVLHSGSGDYFTWVASDDLRSPDFLEANLNFLLRHPDYIGSTSPNRFQYEHNIYSDKCDFDLILEGTSQLTQLLKFANISHGFFYSLFRRDVLMELTDLEENVLAWDWIILLKLCAVGKIHRNELGLITLGADGQSSGSRALSAAGVRGFGYLFPLSKFSYLSIKYLRADGLESLLRNLPQLYKLNLAIYRHIYFGFKHKIKKRILELKRERGWKLPLSRNE